MHKVIFSFAILFLSVNAAAQEGKIRPYTTTELKRWQTLCEWISKPLPAAFDDYTGTHTTCGGFEWSERDTRGNPLTVTNLKNQPTGNRPYYNIYFKMSEEAADSLSKELDAELAKAIKPDNTFDQKKMSEYSNKTQKLNQCKNPTISIAINQNVPISKVYEASTKPIKLTLPITAFAFLYTIPNGKLMGNDNDVVAYDNTSHYQDKAVIIISTKPPKVMPTKVPPTATIKEDVITPTDGCEQSLLPIKNIVVEINGFEKDVRELVNKIDWKALQLLLNK
jgi:hypothetical protein